MGLRKLTTAAPSKMTHSTPDVSHAAETTSKRINKSDFLPDCISAFLDNDGGYKLFWWLKNYSMLPSCTWQQVYIWANSWQLFIKVLISFVFESPFCCFGMLNIGKLFCLMGSYKLSSFNINLLLRNAWNYSFPIILILEIVSITWWPTISCESKIVKSCDSSINGLLYFSNTSTKLCMCFWNCFCLLDVCSWWYVILLVSSRLNGKKDSNLLIQWATSGTHTIHLNSCVEFSINPVAL